MTRKLATFRRVTALEPITGADLIELALIDGWQCVVKKGEFKVGDIGVYFEIDSFLSADDERYAFLEPRFITFEGKRGARIKSMKLKGQLSQGLLLPLSLYPELSDFSVEDKTYRAADLTDKQIAEVDLTETLGIVKWEKVLPANLRGTARGNFPHFIPKTDQERVQNIRDLFEKWGEEVFQETTKMDGSSLTAYTLLPSSPYFAGFAKADENGALPELVQSVCSRNLDLVETEDNMFWRIARQEQLLEKTAALGRSLALQGEMCGSSIQSNFEGFPADTHAFFLYDVWDIDAQEYMTPVQVEHLAQELGIKHVPVGGHFRLNDIAKTKADLLARAEHKGINGKPAEGKVYKHAESGFSFKAISNSYLLKHGE
ncbi:RNA ligase [Burkholderia phage BcepSaruman]|uniref:Putative RNA ligase n=1 Tax=Burkholderia phage BcepSaruman TaxID=2530032 RepID=A0A4D5ZC30_9CAUD|nr:RNA ligase [Burkholderia phage BcepSaruman]QBX06573.1 putative RNA ligase [Burkholderia phage BcepSaruman]